MEATALAVGVLALAGVFHDCMELMSCISDFKSTQKDYEFFRIKFEVEQLLYLQWADRVRLVKQDYDRRLDKPKILDAVTKVLAVVRKLVGDTSALSHQYGLETREALQPGDTTISSVSEHRLARFVRGFEELNLRIGDGQEKKPAIVKLRWVMKDRQKFQVLCKELSYWVSRLNLIIPVALPELIALAQEDLQLQGNSQILRHMREGFASRDTNTLTAGGGVDFGIEDTTRAEDIPERGIGIVADRELRRREDILRRLWFRRMDDRRDVVTPPAAKTLEWALNPPKDKDAEWDDLSAWFCSGSGVYWLSGKAGCGKSTLVKHLYNHSTTKRLLRSWCGPDSLITGCFFFYALGAPDQKTYEGLTRTMLYYILKKNPNRIPKALPKMWREACDGTPFDQLALPSLAETKKAFLQLPGLCQGTKICLFIDALDEYSGDVQDGIAFIETLAASPNVKILVSSRPESDFVAAFSRKPKLAMERLTSDDVQTFVRQTIGVHPSMAALLKQNPTDARATSILTEMVAMAQGVFLWVVLACRSLLDGFARQDGIAELLARVRELPPKIEEMFVYMLERVDKRYHQQTAMLLLTCQRAHTIPGYHPIPTMGLAILEENNMDIRSVSLLGDIPVVERRAKCARLEGRLRSRCGGLVEVKRSKLGLRTMDDKDRDMYTNWSSPGSTDDLVDSTVVFMHRTVVDFLGTDTAAGLDILSVKDSLFDGAAAVSCMWLYLAQVGAHDLHVDACIRRSVHYGTFADQATPGSMTPVLAKLSDLLLHIKSSVPEHYANILSSDPRDKDSTRISFTLAIAVESGMVNLVRAYSAAHNIALPDRPGRFPLLYHALCRPFFNSLLGLDPRSRMPLFTPMVTLLVSAGCRPDEKFRDLLNHETTPRTEWDFLQIWKLKPWPTDEQAKEVEDALWGAREGECPDLQEDSEERPAKRAKHC